MKKISTLIFGIVALFPALSLAGLISTRSTAPTTCAVGDIWINPGAATNDRIYTCTATNTWTKNSGRPWVIQETAPSDLSLIWFDNNQVPGYLVMKLHNGTTWVEQAMGVGGTFDQAGNYTLTGSWDFSGATVTGVSGAALPTWMPSVGPTNGRQILQATGGCTLAAYGNQADCETNNGTWTTPTYQHTSIISGLINDTGTADDDLWSAAKITSELATKQVALSVPDQAEATSGTSSIPRAWTAQRVAQAIAALAPSTIKLRGDTAANWTSNNPILAVMEPGVETDTAKIKIGDGVTAWNLLPYAVSGTSQSATSLQMTFVSDDSLETQTGSKTKVPTGVDFTTADIGCDVSDSITFTLRKSSTVNGTYSTVGTISVSAAAQNESIDISSWANLTAGDWVRIDLTTAGTTAKECTVVIGGTEL